MAEIKIANGQRVVDYMARDYDSLLRSMRDLIPHKLPEWTEYENEADFGNVLLQLFAHMGDILSYYQDRVANESFLGTAQTRRSVLHHLRLIGYELSTAAPASAALTLYLPDNCDEVVTINRGDAFATKSTRDSPSVRFEYNGESPLIIDFSTITASTVKRDGRMEQKKVYASVPVEEGRLVANEMLGTSDGTPNQQYPLTHSPLILRAQGQEHTVNRDVIVLSALKGNGTPWTLQESLAFSRAGQHDVVLRVDENDRAILYFGDGEFGAIPETGATITATYRVGGGTHGNVPAASITTLSDAPQLSLLGAEVSNAEPATGGAARETVDHAVLHAPKVFRSLKRAVTGEDYEALALDFSGVGKVRAEADNWNAVTLFVAPEGGGQVSDVLKADLLAYFEDKRPISTVIEIEGVEYVEIFLTAELEVVSYFERQQIADEVRAVAGALLAFKEVDFGRPVYLSKFFEAIELIEGVKFVNVTEFRRGDDDPSVVVEPSGRIDMAPSEIPVAASAYNGLIRVLATGGF